MHKLYDFHSVEFIRDDNRFTDKYYHAHFEVKNGIPFPDCLHGLLFKLIYQKNTLEISENLIKYFSEYEDLLHFAK